MANTNCLEGFKCPKCGGEERFSITELVSAEVTDDGVESASDFDWDGDSFCACRNTDDCEFEGTVKDFCSK